MIKVTSKGDYSKAINYLGRLEDPIDMDTLKKYGDQGVDVLRQATPVDTGKTRDSWYYEIIKKNGKPYSIQFCNSNIADYVPIAIILQYGHFTGTGGWVEGRDYINPAIRPIFEQMADAIWKEVIK